MLQLVEKALDNSTTEELSKLQDKINSKTEFSLKVRAAQSLWKNKGGKNGKAAFKTIQETLTSMCVAVKICNYCESNEATDIEHIHPKALFPEFTFQWENYILACKICNMTYKADKCFVLDPAGNILETQRKIEPHHKKLAFINPRLENPHDFLWLNLETGKFELQPELTPEKKLKALKTLEILDLNNRDKLVAGRKSSAVHFFDIMDRLRRVTLAQTNEELNDALNPYLSMDIDFTTNLEVIRIEVINSVKQLILKLPHPSVWHSIKTIASRTDPRWERIFIVIPEALDW